MSNSKISVISALYGIPGAVVDVKDSVQDNFDQQYENNNSILVFTLDNILPSLFKLTTDPASGKVKTFTVVYNLPEVGTDNFMRGALDGGSLTLTAGPARTIQVTRAVYGSPTVGFDVTDKLNAYLRDPGNNSDLEIDSQIFRYYLTNGVDIDPFVLKSFSVSYTDTANPGRGTVSLCGFAGQTVNIS